MLARMSLRTPVLAVSLLLLAACGAAVPAGPTVAANVAASPALPERAEVVVVGSGLAGLTAAYRLAAQGVDVVVL